MYGVVLHAHPVRGESYNQRNTTGEVATTSPPFYNEPHWSHVLLCEGWTPHNLHILVTAPFWCDRKSRAACAQSFASWQQATIEFICHNHSVIACACHIYVWWCSSLTPVRGESHDQRNTTGEVATVWARLAWLDSAVDLTQLLFHEIACLFQYTLEICWLCQWSHIFCYFMQCISYYLQQKILL